ncbi:MAG: hypothetical protein GQ537_02310 [Gammaproteobacteria bacterium]|nr:hypothetical protein [Gammaproteobacteria bacterium]
MTITEFHQAVMEALAAEPDEETLQGLASQAQQLGDMVGWAGDIIDKEGRVSDAFRDLQARARTQHEATNDGNVAILHDAIDGLMVAILRHDEDLKPSTDSDDDSGVM